MMIHDVLDKSWSTLNTFSSLFLSVTGDVLERPVVTGPDVTLAN